MERFFAGVATQFPHLGGTTGISMPESAEEVGDGSSLLEQLVGCGFHLRQ